MSVRIGNASGFYGDRFAAVREMLEGGDLDYLTGDYLAELTMLILGRDRAKDPATGYAKTFVRQMQDCLGLAIQRNVKIITNAGGLNPAGLANVLRQIAVTQGIQANIAYVDGDDISDQAADLAIFDALTANAYLGAFGIVEALRGGADIVVTGRVTDASLTVGPAAAHHNWSRTDFDALAGATIAGHVLECGTQTTGGNLGEPGLSFGTARDRRFGFPIAEIAMNGSSVITKHPGTGGAVTLDTVTAQLVYEVDAPHYAGPDVVARLDTVRLDIEGPDRVSISGVRGLPPPSTAKVGITRLGGFRNSVEFLLTGLDIDEKAQLVRAQMSDALASSPPDEVDWQLDRTVRDDPETQAEATARLRCQVRSSSADTVGRTFSGAAVELALSSYAGFTLTRPPAAATPYGVFSAAYVDQSVPRHRVVRTDGTSTAIPPPVEFGSPGGWAAADAPSPLAPPPTAGLAVRIPLGRIALARSGDKGGDANIGVWVRSDHPRRELASEWLRGLLDVATVRRLLPEAGPLDIDVYELRNLGAVNIVVHGLLGDGVAASTRFDPQAKALGEWLRSRHVDVPAELAPAVAHER